MESKSFFELISDIGKSGIWNSTDKLFKIISWSGIVGLLRAISDENREILIIYEICFSMLFISIGSATTTLSNTILELISSLFRKKSVPVYVRIALFIPVSAAIYYFSNSIFVHNIDELIKEYIKNFKPR